ncbi:MAG: response regulator [Pseudomonas sp.]
MTRVLIVEDEELIGMLLEEMLISHGFEVAGRATTVEESHALVAAEQVDVVLLDISLHGEPVFPVAEQLSQRGTPFVFTTGYGAAGLPTEWQGHPVFCKPYNIQELTETLTQLGEQRS